MYSYPPGSSRKGGEAFPHTGAEGLYLLGVAIEKRDVLELPPNLLHFLRVAERGQAIRILVILSPGLIGPPEQLPGGFYRLFQAPADQLRTQFLELRVVAVQQAVQGMGRFLLRILIPGAVLIEILKLIFYFCSYLSCSFFRISW